MSTQALPLGAFQATTMLLSFLEVADSSVTCVYVYVWGGCSIRRQGATWRLRVLARHSVPRHARVTPRSAAVARWQVEHVFTQ